MQSGKKIPAVEYLLRSSGWLIFISAEKVAGTILRYTPADMKYYLFAIFLTLCLLGAMRRLGESLLILDLKELCLYDFFVQCYGLLLNRLVYSYDSYLILANAVLLLKFVRLIWWARNNEGDFIAGWPVFGLLGFFNRDRNRQQMASGQRLAIYVVCAIAPVVTYFIADFTEIIPAAILHVLTLIVVLVFVKPVINEIRRSEEEAIEKNTQLARLTAQTEMDAQLKERNIDLCHATHDVIAPVTAMARLARSLTQATHIEQAQATGRHFEAGLHELGDLLEEIVRMAEVVTRNEGRNDETINMDELSYSLYAKLLPLAQERGILFTTDEAPFEVASSTWLLQRILSNLLANAILHGNDTTKVRLVIKRNATMCTLRIWDTGPGIPNANGPDRAANFTKLLIDIGNTKSAAAPTPKTGHMLGLRSVMRMCNTLGIRITLVSKLGKGSMFRLRVPLALYKTTKA